MKWFKHENTFNNPKIMLLTSRHGVMGYGVYFSILEILSEHIEPSNRDQWGYLPETYSKYPEILAQKLHIDIKELDQCLDTCYEIGLFTKTDKGLYCEKILERCDRYTELLLKQTVHKKPEDVHKVAESTPRIDKNRIDKNKNIKEKTYKKESLSDKKTSKNSITPCTPDELVEISETLKVPLDVVERKHQRILEMLETKEFNKRKYKTIFYTLKSWIDLDIQRGFIKKPMGVISI